MSYTKIVKIIEQKGVEILYNVEEIHGFVGCPRTQILDHNRRKEFFEHNFIKSCYLLLKYIFADTDKIINVYSNLNYDYYNVVL